MKWLTFLLPPFWWLWLRSGPPSLSNTIWRCVPSCCARALTSLVRLFRIESWNGFLLGGEQVDPAVSLNPRGFPSRGQDMGIDSGSLRGQIAKTSWNKIKTGSIPIQTEQLFRVRLNFKSDEINPCGIGHRTRPKLPNHCGRSLSPLPYTLSLTFLHHASFFLMNNTIAHPNPAVMVTMVTLAPGSGGGPLCRTRLLPLIKP